MVLGHNKSDGTYGSVILLEKAHVKVPGKVVNIFFFINSFTFISTWGVVLCGYEKLWRKNTCLRVELYYYGNDWTLLWKIKLGIILITFIYNQLSLYRNAISVTITVMVTSLKWCDKEGDTVVCSQISTNAMKYPLKTTMWVFFTHLWCSNINLVDWKF